MGITGSVRFGDNSVVEIRGRGIVLINIRGSKLCALTNVYYASQSSRQAS
jgi:hypothetical protein